MKVARIFLESNDDGIVMTSSYADPRGGVWWWGDNDWDRSVRNVEVCHSYINSGGGKAIALIPWGSTNPDQQKQETDNVNVYDNVLMGGYSVGTWCDNPFDGKPFDNTEENDYAPVKNFRIVNNEYLSPCDLLSIRPTNFITDCGLHSSETFRNGDFAHGHTYWTTEGDAGEQDGSGYARGEGRLYEGLYLKKGRHVFTADVRSKGELFVENATNGQTVESLAFDTDEWTPRRIVIDAVADDTYYLGIKGPDAESATPCSTVRTRSNSAYAQKTARLPSIRKPRFLRNGSQGPTIPERTHSSGASCTSRQNGSGPQISVFSTRRKSASLHDRTDRAGRSCRKRPGGTISACATDPAKIRTLGTSTQTDYVPIPDAMALAALWAQADLQGRPPVRSLEGVVADSAGSGRSSERPYC